MVKCLQHKDYRLLNKIPEQHYQPAECGLQVTRLQDLLPWLPPRESDGTKVKVYQANQSLLEVLEDIEVSSFIKIVRLSGGGSCTVNGDDLLAAFYQFKESLN